ncbi:GNAT family N-acetyltransferase [Tumebacillus flagellatus]|uniref:GNAT family N-acetyltransferase n=1 Tax=Tumebacillus flagellatus TaxID=1157490 RepID=UPI001EE6886C|nr:GNAT family N-acetyltransferase [Tumebacillus flagellatus]
MIALTLRGVTKANWETCIQLRPAEGRERFVASNVYSLAESKFLTNMRPLAIYQEEEMVGFLMYGIDPDDDNYWVYRLMVDRNHQRQGYGKGAMKLLLEKLRDEAERDLLVIGYHPENEGADRLYASLGFEKNGHGLPGVRGSRRCGCVERGNLIIEIGSFFVGGQCWDSKCE